MFTHERNPCPRRLCPYMNKPKNSDTSSNTQKDPADWKTGDEPMTGAQRSYLETLSAEAKEPVEDDLTKADASRKIDELQKKTGRGVETKR
jgi:hypothetical protein